MYEHNRVCIHEIQKRRNGEIYLWKEVELVGINSVNYIDSLNSAAVSVDWDRQYNLFFAVVFPRWNNLSFQKVKKKNKNEKPLISGKFEIKKNRNLKKKWKFSVDLNSVVTIATCLKRN